MNQNARPTRKSGARLWANLRPRARAMRHEPTPAEDMLWKRLRNRGAGGLKFRRQHAIGQFIVDFYCADANLVVELDGGAHKTRAVEDRLREHDLSMRTLKILRFRNDEVTADVERVLARILGEAGSRDPDEPHSPSPRSGEGARG